jgi:hypothetical protein
MVTAHHAPQSRRTGVRIERRVRREPEMVAQPRQRERDMRRRVRQRRAGRQRHIGVEHGGQTGRLGAHKHQRRAFGPAHIGEHRIDAREIDLREPGRVGGHRGVGVVDDHALAGIVDHHRRTRGRTPREAAQLRAVDTVAAELALDLVGDRVIADASREPRAAAEARDGHRGRRRRAAADAGETRGAVLRAADRQSRQPVDMVLHGMTDTQHRLGGDADIDGRRHDSVTA